MYNDEVMERYQNPRFYGKPGKYNISLEESSTTCGDHIHFYIEIEDGKVKDIGFEGNGCIISMVSSDLFCESARGKTVEEVVGADPDKYVSEFPVPISPGRLNCALLPLKSFKKVQEKLKK